MSSETSPEKGIKKISRKPQARPAQSSMRLSGGGRRLSGGQNALVIFTQILFLLMGLVFLLLGGGRILLEFSGDTVQDILADNFNENLTGIPSLLLMAPMVFLGYGLIWSMVALGAKEPPAWQAGRTGLNAILVGLLVIAGLIIWIYSEIAIFALPALVVLAVLTGFLRYQFSDERLRMVLGGVQLKKPETRIFTFWNMMLVMGVSLLVVLGVVYAVLTDIIELPLPVPESGELLYITTFDEFNDEWDQEDDLEASAEVTRDRYLVLQGASDATTAFLANRLYDSFDLEVDMQYLTPDTEGVYGVVYRWQNADNYYAFELNESGAYRLRKVVEGEEQIISDWQQSEVIQPDDVNTIRIVAIFEQFYFFANGEHLTLCATEVDTCETPEDVFRDAAYFPAGSLGLITSGDGAEAAFDNLVMYDFPLDAFAPRPDDVFVLYRSDFNLRSTEADWPADKAGVSFRAESQTDPRMVVTMASGDLNDSQFTILNRKFRDFDLRVTTTQLLSDPDNFTEYGVMFRYRDNENYYMFKVTGDGWYRILEVEDGVTEVVSTWIPTTDISDFSLDEMPTLIRPGETNIPDTVFDRQNELRVVAQGDKFWFYVNGQHLKLCQGAGDTASTFISYDGSNRCDSDVLTDYYQDDSFQQGRIGLFAGYNADSNLDYPVSVAFDNLLIVGPEDNFSPTDEEKTFWRNYYE